MKKILKIIGLFCSGMVLAKLYIAGDFDGLIKLIISTICLAAVITIYELGK